MKSKERRGGGSGGGKSGAMVTHERWNAVRFHVILSAATACPSPVQHRWVRSKAQQQRRWERNMDNGMASGGSPQLDMGSRPPHAQQRGRGGGGRGWPGEAVAQRTRRRGGAGEVEVGRSLRVDGVEHIPGQPRHKLPASTPPSCSAARTRRRGAAPALHCPRRPSPRRSPARGLKPKPPPPCVGAGLPAPATRRQPAGAHSPPARRHWLHRRRSGCSGWGIFLRKW
jgi:hypothetical protein